MLKDNIARNKSKISTGKPLDEVQSIDKNMKPALCHQKTEGHIMFLDNNDKLQEDRDYIEKTISRIQTELIKERTYNSLLEAISYEKEQNIILDDTKKKELEMNETIEGLKEEITKTVQNTINNLQEKEIEIADKKHSLQKSKKRIQIEVEYMSNKSKNAIAQCKERTSMKLDVKRKQLERDIIIQ
ncbi:IQ domain-containing protein G-like [Centruroides sculpturatus]|uniref:IQ domain-containing protein G-like n=1 Tax=Centruroides sculpturatus TaxID=218467 RepID=UPI000C6DD09B|nr:IQ domain-containing protein G-like [Centruroides sculpturatus]